MGLCASRGLEQTDGLRKPIRPRWATVAPTILSKLRTGRSIESHLRRAPQLTFRRFGHTTVVTIGVCGFLNASVLAQSARETVTPLPKPSGTFAIGTATVYLTDSTRRDVDLPDGRPITVQLWYPATGDGPVARYLVERSLLASMLRNDYYGIDTTALRAWGTLATHAHIDASPVRGKHPLIAFSVGLGVARANYTSIAEELASFGYAVVLVESPLQGYMVLPNDREVIDTAGRFGETAAHRQGVTDWAKDILVRARCAAGRAGASRGDKRRQVHRLVSHWRRRTLVRRTGRDRRVRNGCTRSRVRRHGRRRRGSRQTAAR